jgi:hypothetical protein
MVVTTPVFLEIWFMITSNKTFFLEHAGAAYHYIKKKKRGRTLTNTHIATPGPSKPTRACYKRVWPRPKPTNLVWPQGKKVWNTFSPAKPQKCSSSPVSCKTLIRFGDTPSKTQLLQCFQSVLSVGPWTPCTCEQLAHRHTHTHTHS